MTGPAARDVELTVEGAIATVLLNRPAKRNALSRSMIAELKALLRQADHDPAVRVVAIRGAGADFCSGMDLADLQSMSSATVLENLADVEELSELFLLIRRLRNPVVAVVTGRALAGGCGLATACDLVIASESARFGYPEVHIGFVPALVAAILRRNVGEKRAFDMIVRGTVFTASEAERVGLINQVFSDEAIAESADGYLRELSELSVSAVQLCKRVLYTQDGLSFEAALAVGADANVLARSTEDVRRGVAAFLEKRSAPGKDD